MDQLTEKEKEYLTVKAASKIHNITKLYGIDFPSLDAKTRGMFIEIFIAGGIMILEFENEKNK
jgi:hypothetical protein